MVKEPSVVLLRVDNAGGMDIEPHHMHEKVSFAFPDRTIVGLEVTEAKPEALGEMLQRQLDSEKFVDSSRLVLPRTAINRGDSFKFLLVLSGRGEGVTHSGYLAGGSAGGGVYHEPRPRGPGRRTLMFGALSLVLVGALVALFLVDVLQPPDNCAAGQLRVVGSTAVEPTVKEARSAYVAECTEADITIAAGGSRSGTRLLADTGQKDPDHVGRLPDQGRSGRQAPAERSRDDGGAAEPGRRPAVCRASGTAGHGASSPGLPSSLQSLRSLRSSVQTGRPHDLDGAIGYAELGGSRKYPTLTPVAIDGVVPATEKVADRTYRFWEVEHAYTAAPPKPDSLQEAFLDYLTSPQAEPILGRDGLVPCSNLPGDFCG